MNAVNVQAVNIQAVNIQVANVGVAWPASRLGDCGGPNCPRCGSVVHLAERSAFNLQGCIRHHWACDACGEEFATSISVLPLRV